MVKATFRSLSSQNHGTGVTKGYGRRMKKMVEQVRTLGDGFNDEEEKKR